MENNSKTFRFLLEKRKLGKENHYCAECIATYHHYVASWHFFILKRKLGKENQYCAECITIYHHYVASWLIYISQIRISGMVMALRRVLSATEDDTKSVFRL